MSDRYIWHLTLDTGHGRRSYRDEVDDAVVSVVGQQLAEALAGIPVEVRPGYRLRGDVAGGALLATVERKDIGPLATIAVAETSLQGAKLWRLLRQPVAAGSPAVGDAPRPPWCAVRLYPALARDRAAASWLGDLGRILAWAWIERERP